MDDGAITAWDYSIAILNEWPDSLDSCPDLSKLIVSIASNWKQKRHTKTYKKPPLMELIRCSKRRILLAGDYF